MSATKAARSGRNALSSMCRSCRRLQIRQTRPFSSTSTCKADEARSEAASAAPQQPTRKRSQIDVLKNLRAMHSKNIEDRKQKQAEESAFTQTLSDLRPGSPSSSSSSSSTNPTSSGSTRGTTSTVSTLFRNARTESATRVGSGGIPHDEPYHIHVFAHKQNCHVTFSEPSRNAILSFSCGNIGLKKAQRSSFDAAYQLATYAMKKIAMHSWRNGGKKMNPEQAPLRTIKDVEVLGIEVVMRGFGQGREAFQKALLGSEGFLIRPMVKRVTDATRLKFGGARSPQVRRL